MKKQKGTKIKLEFIIPDESPQKEKIARKFTDLWDALNENGQGALVNEKTTDKNKL